VGQWLERIGGASPGIWDDDVFGRAPQGSELRWFHDRLASQAWSDGEEVDVAKMTADIRARMIENDAGSSSAPCDSDPVQLWRELSRRYLPPMTERDVSDWFWDSVRERGMSGDPLLGTGRLLLHVQSCKTCSTHFDWTELAFSTTTTCHELEQGDVDRSRAEVERLACSGARESGEQASDGFANPWVVALLHRLSCPACTGSFVACGSPFSPGCEWAGIIAHVAGGIDLDRLRVDPPAAGWPRTPQVYAREEGDSTSAAQIVKLLSANRVQWVSAEPKADRSARALLRSQPTLDGNQCLVVPSFVVRKTTFVLCSSEQLRAGAFGAPGGDDIARPILHKVDSGSGKPRLVLDFSNANARWRKVSYSLRSLDLRAAKWRPGDFLSVADIEGAFTKVFLRRHLRHSFCFTVDREHDDSVDLYAATHWPFGHTLSPAAFSLVAAAAVAGVNQIFRAMGLPPTLDAYVDDLIMAAESEHAARRQLDAATAWFARMGLPLAEGKRQGPSRAVSYLGRRTSTFPFVDLPMLEDKRATLEWVSGHSLKGGAATRRAWEALVGTLVNHCYAAFDAFGLARTLGFAVWRDMHPQGRTKRYFSPTSTWTLGQCRWSRISSRCLSDMMDALVSTPARPRVEIRQGGPPVAATTLLPFRWYASSDASETGCGGFIGDTMTRGLHPWHSSWRSHSEEADDHAPAALFHLVEDQSSTLRELAGLAATLEVLSSMHRPPGRQLLLFVCDNRALVYAVNRRAAGKRPIGELLSLITRTAIELDVVIVAVHVSRESIPQVDDLSRTSALSHLLPRVHLTDDVESLLCRWCSSFDLERPSFMARKRRHEQAD